MIGALAFVVIGVGGLFIAAWLMGMVGSAAEKAQGTGPEPTWAGPLTYAVFIGVAGLVVCALSYAR